MFYNYVFHRDDLVPEFVEDVREWFDASEDYLFKRGERVKNIHRDNVLMIISKEVRVGKHLIGFECYWWEG